MNPLPPGTLSGRVEATLILQDPSSSRSTPLPKIEVFTRLGVKGDRHAGRRTLDVREKTLLHFGFPKGMDIANHREVSIVSAEELAEIQKSLGIPTPIPPGCLGENLVVSGIPRLTELPSGTLLLFQTGETMRTAVLAVWGETTPCFAPGKALQQQFPDSSNVAKRFATEALHLRGVVATVYVSGVIKPGDTVLAVPPERRLVLPSPT